MGSTLSDEKSASGYEKEPSTRLNSSPHLDGQQKSEHPVFKVDQTHGIRRTTNGEVRWQVARGSLLVVRAADFESSEIYQGLSSA